VTIVAIEMQGDSRPDFICVVQSLLMAAGEEKVQGDMKGALKDLQQKFVGGLNAIFYKDVPYLPVYIAAGSIIQFGILKPDGQVHIIVHFVVLIPKVKLGSLSYSHFP
jgi:ABC-type protease/lipase transport system fused ATPase/permease subunit